jgi:hypothetical protein
MEEVTPSTAVCRRAPGEVHQPFRDAMIRAIRPALSVDSLSARVDRVDDEVLYLVVVLHQTDAVVVGVDRK